MNNLHFCLFHCFGKMVALFNYIFGHLFFSIKSIKLVIKIKKYIHSKVKIMFSF